MISKVFKIKSLIMELIDHLIHDLIGKTMSLDFIIEEDINIAKSIIISMQNLLVFCRAINNKMLNFSDLQNYCNNNNITYDVQSTLNHIPSIAGYLLITKAIHKIVIIDNKISYENNKANNMIMMIKNIFKHQCTYENNQIIIEL